MKTASVKSSSVSVSLYFATWDLNDQKAILTIWHPFSAVLICHLYLVDEVQLFYLHMNMSLQKLVKKFFKNFSLRAPDDPDIFYVRILRVGYIFCVN